MKSNHMPEHHTYPPGKMIPRQVMQVTEKNKLAQRGFDARFIMSLGWQPGGRRIKKKVHNRRSRQYLKRQLRNEVG